MHKKVICETERIVNIGELERGIQRARLKLIAIKETVTDNDSLKDSLNAVINDLFDCEHFDFLLEHRKVIRKSLFETLVISQYQYEDRCH